MFFFPPQDDLSREREKSLDLIILNISGLFLVFRERLIECIDGV